MTVLFEDADIFVCVKPIGMDSERLDVDMPLFTVHRLDKQVSGVMVYAKTKQAAAHLSTQMQAHTFTKEYRAVIEGVLPSDATTDNTAQHKPTTDENVSRETNCTAQAGNFGACQTMTRWEDLLYHDKRKNKVFTVKKERKGVKHAALRHQVLGVADIAQSASAPIAAANTQCSLLKIVLETGRTHQIRVQCASRKHPLLGDNRYGSQTKGCDIALFSHTLGFAHPRTKEPMVFSHPVPDTYPWTLFAECESEPRAFL